jgi:gluconolactonase
MSAWKAPVHFCKFAKRPVLHIATIGILITCLTLGHPRPTPAADRPVSGGRVLGLNAICDQCGLSVFARCDGLLEGPSFDRENNLWLTSPSKGRIYKVTPDGTCAVAVENPVPHFIPGGMKLNRDGRLYGTNVGTNDLFALNVDTRQFTIVSRTDVATQTDSSISTSDGYFGYNDLIFDAVGGAFLTDMRGSSVLRATGRIVYRTAAGEVREAVPTGLALPDGIVLSPDGKLLYFNEWLTNRIIAVPVQDNGVLNLGLASVFAYLAGGRGPDGMAVDASGNLYVAHQGSGGEIAVFAPDGSYFGALRPKDGRDFSPTNLTFHNNELYVTEGRLTTGTQQGNAVWRIRIKIAGLRLYGDD